MLPAERDAASRVVAPLPRHRDGDGRPAASVRVVDDPHRRARRRPGRARRRDGLSVVGHGRGRSRLEHRCRVDAVAPDPGMGPGGDRRRRAGRAGRVRHADTALAGRRPRRAGARRRRRGSPPRIRTSTPFAGASRSNAARSSTASSSTTFPPARIWPTSLSTLRPTPSTAARSRSWAACPACRSRASSATTNGWRQTEYRDLRELPATSAAPTQLLAVPYFAWANRDEGGMRVWIPVAN